MTGSTHPVFRAAGKARLDPAKLRAAAGLFDWLDYLWPAVDEEARAEACVAMVLGIAPTAITGAAVRELETVSRQLTAERFTTTPRRS